MGQNHGLASLLGWAPASLGANIINWQLSAIRVSEIGNMQGWKQYIWPYQYIMKKESKKIKSN